MQRLGECTEGTLIRAEEGPNCYMPPLQLTWFNQFSHLQWQLTRRVIHKLDFRPDDNVLDVGCGTGEETKSIAMKVGSVTGESLLF